ncbi:MAG TPA: hypothetical protein PLW95_05770 [bacterium]|nr:hypothetical protein [bacterium]
MKITLKTNHPLFQRLKDNPPQWWQNLKSDPEIYIDIRKENYLNVYHNGGSIMKLGGTKGYKAQIHTEYIPLNTTAKYLPFEFQEGNISLKELQTIDIRNFEREALERIKKRIRKFYPNGSEKGIQGQYVINNNKKRRGEGFFIDTEMAYGNNRKDMKRIDMVWVNMKTREIAFVELKTMGDDRLYATERESNETIDKQLKKYYEFAKGNRNDLIEYYNRVYQVKKELGLLPRFAKDDSLKNYRLIERPILLVGDCTQQWIDKNAEDINNWLKDIAFGCLYQGKTNYNFKIPYEKSQNCFPLAEE